MTDHPLSVGDLLQIPASVSPFGQGSLFESRPGPDGYSCQITEIQGDKVRVHPYHGPDAGWFDSTQVKIWRDEAWSRWNLIGLTPAVMARMMYPENWK